MSTTRRQAQETKAFEQVLAGLPPLVLQGKGHNQSTSAAIVQRVTRQQQQKQRKV